ncbi:hypothetical protein DL96DRAFT_746503 [Flagelloscypha sp. PMI_526]|nr:hypothetical protein DL96DRAFT_746503 [Flagelloscypha sp. PMI_526]
MAAAKAPPSHEPGKGLRILTLDGSSLITAASSEVFFLEGIAHRWAFDDPEKGKAKDGTDVRISEMFDIVGGTGIGGFYAILFTALNMTIGQVIKCQRILHEKLFTSKSWAEKDHHGCTKALDEALDEIHTKLCVSLDLDSSFCSDSFTKCFISVLNTSAPHPRALRSYRIRAVPSPQCTIRQVFHATLADSEHLPPTFIHDEHFVNASTSCANPSLELMKDLVAAFPRNSYLACFVNVGAGWTKLPNNSESVANNLLSMFQNLQCFFRLSVKKELSGESISGIKSLIMCSLQEERISEDVDDIVEALLHPHNVIPLERLGMILLISVRTLTTVPLL